MNGSLPALALGLALALSACGSSTGDDAQTAAESTGATETSSSAPAQAEPACAAVWASGQDLPEDYSGCSEEGTWVKADAQRCASGQVLVTFGDRFYAAKGQQVNDAGSPLSENPQYQRAVKSCG